MRASIILLCYNQETYIADAICSVLYQRCEPIRIIISDDASRDATFEIASKIVDMYRGPHKVSLFRNSRNLGLCKNINLCMDRVDTEYVIAAAGDDISMPNRAARILKEFDDTHALLVHSAVCEIGQRGVRTAPSAPLLSGPTSIFSAATEMCLYIGATGAWNRSLFDQFGPIDDGCFEDLILGFRAMLDGQVAFVNEQLVQYRTGVGLSFREDQINDIESWRQARQGDLQFRCRILSQRLRDTENSDNTNKIAISKILTKRISYYRLQDTSYAYSPLQFILNNYKRLPLSLRALISERSRLRRARIQIEGRSPTVSA